MARIAGVDLPREKRVEIGLTYIYGIGRPTALAILEKAGINPDTRVKDLTEDEAGAIRKIIDAEYVVEGVIKGKIPYQKRGNNGFGFDPIFELENGKTLAELEEYEKNNVSSRKIALKKLESLLKNQ